MKTTQYNPSKIEVEFATAIAELSGEIEKRLSSNKIVTFNNKIETDNPTLFFQLQDQDGDHHEVVLKIIQRADKP